MKRIKFAVAAMLLLFSVSLFATQPTVTRTKIASKTGVFSLYKFTFSTAIATSDSMFLGITGTAGSDKDSFWNTQDLLENPGDSASVTIWYSTSEATADSSVLSIAHQWSMNPGTSSYATSDWVSNSTDTGIDNVTGVVYKYTLLNKGAGLKYRIVLYENDTSKDATQNITVYVLVRL